MIKFISLTIYSILKLINYFFEKIVHRNILVWIKSYIEQDSYEKITLKSGKDLNFFSPNFLTNILIKDF